MKRRTLLQALSASVWIGAMPWVQAAELGSHLHTLVIRDDYLGMRDLLRQGLDPNTRDRQGVPMLVKAMQQESLRVADELLNSPKIKVDLASPSGETALMYASIKGNLALVQRLLAMGASVNKPGWTPLHYAASANHEHSTEIVRLLLENHAYIDAESPNKSTPLMLAAQYGSEGMVKLLLDEGADVQLRNQQGLSAVDFARRSEREFMVKMLDEAYLATRRSKASW